MLYGIDYDSFNALKPFVFLAGGPFQGPNDVIVDDVFASSDKGYHVGDTITIMDHPFRISGIVEHGKGGRKLMPIDTMGELTGAEGKASLFYIKCDDPANENAVIQEIHATRGLEDYPVETMDEWLEEMTPDKTSRLQHRSRRGHFDRGDCRIPGHLPVDVYGGAGADARDRHSEVDGRVEADHCGRGAARDRGDGGGRRGGGHRGHVWRAKLLMAHLFPTQHFEITGRWIAQGGGNCLCRRDVAARSTRPGWPPAKTPSTRWHTNRAFYGNGRGLLDLN